MNEYHVGDLVHCKAVFTNLSGALIDPSTVILKVRKPDDTTASYIYGSSAMVHESQGIYSMDLAANLAGTWYYEFSATGVGQCAGDNRFFVKDSQFN